MGEPAKEEDGAEVAEEPQADAAGEAAQEAEASAGADDAMEEAKDDVKDEAKDEVKDEAKDEVKDEEDAEMKAEDAEAKAETKAEDTDKLKPKGPKKLEENEQDAVEDSRPKVPAGAAAFSDGGATLNAMVMQGGQVLMSLNDPGFQHLLAGARASVGVKSGRYMFEVRVLEMIQQHGNKIRSQIPQNYLRVGFSLAGSGLPLIESKDFACFDNEGFFLAGKSRRKVSQRFHHEQTVAVVLNLDAASPNANTISFFRNGERVSEPQALPEGLIGKALFPAVAYKNMNLQANMGPAPFAPLQFKCAMVAEAAAEDAEVVPAADADEKFEVVFPVGLPDTGYFDWVDDFVSSNPHEEVSDRMVLEMAAKSGLWRPPSARGSNDKPETKFNVKSIDDRSLRRMLTHLAQTSRRSFVIPEMASNLQEAGRKTLLSKFASPSFKKIAMVLLGEPPAEHKEKIQALMLADKQATLDAKFKAKREEANRKRLLEAKKKKAEAAKKAREAAAKKKEAGADADEVEEPVEDAPEEEAPAEESPPQAELTDEEKKVWVRKSAVPDLSEQVLGNSYSSFSLPSTAEGFDQVKYVWQSEAECATILKDWIFAKKMTQRVADLQPGKGFKDAWAAWTKELAALKAKQNEWKDPAKRKAARAKRREASKKAVEEAKKAAEEAGEEPPAEAEAPPEEDGEPQEIDLDEVDVASVEDVKDLGNGQPLCSGFAPEDWVLLSTRFELHLLMHSFRQDLNDPDRPGFSAAHVAFYYQKYYKKPFHLKAFNFDSFPKFAEQLLDGTLTINEKSGFLEPALPEETPAAEFVKQVEEHRRERQRRSDAGDETAALKFSLPSSQSSGPRTAARPNKPGATKQFQRPVMQMKPGAMKQVIQKVGMQKAKTMEGPRPARPAGPLRTTGPRPPVMAPGPSQPGARPRPPMVRPVHIQRGAAPRSFGGQPQAFAGSMGAPVRAARPFGGPRPPMTAPPGKGGAAIGGIKRPFPVGPQGGGYPPNKAARPGPAHWKGW